MSSLETKPVAHRHHRRGFELAAVLLPLQRVLDMDVIQEHFLNFFGVGGRQRIETIFSEITAGESSHRVLCPQQHPLSRKRIGEKPIKK